MKNKVEQQLATFQRKLAKHTGTSLGYPGNERYDYSSLHSFFKYSINNIGDPFQDSNFKLSSRSFEKKVLYFFAKLYKIPQSEFWGYMTHGGTEGNLYGLFIARNKFPQGIVYFSQDAHYSILKATKLLRMQHTIIPSLKNGEIDYAKFEAAVRKNRGTPVIVSVTVGTTMKGAIDSVTKIQDILRNNKIKKSYIHCDAALFGMLLPFIKEAPKINFIAGIDSLAISGHKFIGSPIPCGIVLTKKAYVEKIKKEVEYVGNLDTTISGSRNGHSPLLLWYAIQTKGMKGFKLDAIECLENAKYLFSQLQGMQYPCFINPFSNIVVFKKPSVRLMGKWQLASQKSWAHIVVMKHVSKSKIDAFITDLKKEVKAINKNAIG